MKQKIDFILNEDYWMGEGTRLLFRFYPKKSRCYCKYSKPPKYWDEIYEVDYVWSIFSQYKDENEGPNWMMNSRNFDCLGDENSIIGLIAEFCNILADGKEEYIWKDTDGKTHITKILDHEHITFGDGVNWVINKHKKTNCYEFSLWNFDDTGYRFILPADKLKSFGEYLRKCCDYMLRHAELNKNFTKKFMWNRFDLRQWNTHLAYHQNLNNGINLPEEDVPVIIHNYDNCKYYIGRFSKL